MVSDRLFEKIRGRVGKTEVDRQQAARVRYQVLNEKLEAQLRSQAMTTELLSKFCTL